MRLLYLDFSNKDEIKILNTITKKSLTIISAYFIPLTDDIEPIKAVSNKLKNEQLLNIPAIIIPPRSITHYHSFSFPKIPEKEIRKILPREIQKLTDHSPENIIFDFNTGATDTDVNENKTNIITYYFEKNIIWDMLENLKANGITAIKIIPEVQIIESFIQNNFLTKEKSETNGIVVIDMISNKINMNIFNKNFWSLNREFPFKGSGTTEISDKDFSRISTEFSRTFQFFKQKNKNISIDEAIIYGTNHDIVDLNNFINETQPVNATLISNIKSDLEVTYPQNLKSKDEFLSMFFISISAASSLIRKDFIDLFPKEFTEKEKFPKQLLIFSLIGLVVLILLTVLTTISLNQKNQYRTDLEKIESEYNTLQTQIDQILEVRKKRKDYYEKIIIMETPKRISFQISDFIRKISLEIDQDLPVIISKFNVSPKEEKLTFSIDGKIKSDHINESIKTFDILLNKVKNLEGIEILNFSPPSTATLSQENKELLWDFNIKGNKELMIILRDNEK